MPTNWKQDINDTLEENKKLDKKTKPFILIGFLIGIVFLAYVIIILYFFV